jgi:hypothetical protein
LQEQLDSPFQTTENNKIVLEFAAHRGNVEAFRQLLGILMAPVEAQHPTMPMPYDLEGQIRVEVADSLENVFELACCAAPGIEEEAFDKKFSEYMAVLQTGFDNSNAKQLYASIVSFMLPRYYGAQGFETREGLSEPARQLHEYLLKNSITPSENAAILSERDTRSRRDLLYRLTELVVQEDVDFAGVLLTDFIETDFLDETDKNKVSVWKKQLSFNAEDVY